MQADTGRNTAEKERWHILGNNPHYISITLKHHNINNSKSTSLRKARVL